MLRVDYFFSQKIRKTEKFLRLEGDRSWSRVARTPPKGHEARLEAYKCCTLNGSHTKSDAAAAEKCKPRRGRLYRPDMPSCAPTTALPPPTERATGQNALTLCRTASSSTRAHQLRETSAIISSDGTISLTALLANYYSRH